MSGQFQKDLERSLRLRFSDSKTPEYILRWKHWDMPSGPPICALRASARRTSGNGFGGWPTPNLTDHKGAGQPDGRRPVCDDDLPSRVERIAGWPTPRAITGGPESAERKQELGRTESGGGDLQAAAHLVGWPTPCQQDGPKGGPGQGEDRLPAAAMLAGWQTPQAQDCKQNGDRQNSNAVMNIQIAHGLNPASSNAGTESNGASRLNPRFSLWLMGYPTEWASCGERVTR